MHFFRSCFLIVLLYFCSVALVQAQTQTCSVSITPPTTVQDSVCYGTPLNVVTTGTGPFQYQWQKDGVNLSGQTATSRTFPVSESGSYTVIARSSSCTDTSEAITVNVKVAEAKFSVENREAMAPQSADTCGIPVKVTLANESTGTGLTYKWRITDSSGEPIEAPTVKFIENTDSTSKEPILQFNEKGQYTIRLIIEFQGACFNTSDPEGPLDPIDPDNPDAERDGRYVHEEQVIIVYPQVSPQAFQACEDLTPGATVTLPGSQLAILDSNTPEGKKDIEWKVVSGTGVIISDPTIESPEITFPATGSYVLSVRFANNCEFSDALPGSTTSNITVTFNPRPLAPRLAKAEDYICEGSSYTITPSPANPSRLYNFYTTPSGGTPLNAGSPQASYSANPSSRTVYYIATVENGCESQDRSMFTLNLLQQDLDNLIGNDQTICANTAPAILTGNEVEVETATPIYLWESRAEGEAEFAAASSDANRRNDQQNYTPATLSKTTTYRRSVTFANCENPVYSNEITVEVLPVIDPATNTIQADDELVCEGAVPVLTGSPIPGDIEYVWQSSTTSATTGFIPAVGSDNTNGSQFTPAFLTQPTWYRRMARYAGSACAQDSSAVVFINIDALPTAPVVTASDVEACQDKSAVLAVSPIAPGTTYIWYTEATGGTPIGSGSPFVTPVLSSDITFYVEAVNQNECASPTRTPVRVNIVSISAFAGRDTTIIEGQSMELKGSGTGGVTYSWSPSSGLNRSDVANPVATPSETTTYTLTVTNEAGCAATDQVTLTVTPRIVVVNTFSPNQDGVNETWDIPNLAAYPQASVEIFNRWGARVFQSSGYPTPWDGTHNGSPLPLATYYYVIRLNPDQKPITGSVTIIR